MTPKQLKKKLWPIFSEYIRLNESDQSGYCLCVTCGVKKFWKGDGMHAGHFQPGRTNSVLFEEDQVHPQCVKCNFYGHANRTAGMQQEYMLYQIARYGLSEVKRMIKQKKQPKKYTASELEEKIDYYKELVKQIKQQKNL